MSGKRLIVVASIICTAIIWFIHGVYHAIVLNDGTISENLVLDLVSHDGLFGLTILTLCLAIGFMTAFAYRNKAEIVSKSELTRRNAELETLRAIALEISSSRDLDQILNTVLKHLETLVPYISSGIALIEQDQPKIYLNRGFPTALDYPAIESHLSTAPHWQKLIESQAVHIIPDVHTDPDWLVTPGQEYIHAWMGVPLVSRGHSIGALFFDHSQADFYTTHHAEVAMAVAQQTAIAIENARLYQRLEAEVAQSTHELKSEKDRNETIVQNVADAIIFTDPAGDILYVNPAWEQLTGYSLAEAIGQNPRIVQSGETPRAVYEDMWATILRGKLWQGLVTNKRRDGTLYEAEMKIAPVQDDAGEIQFFVALQRDVTAARQLEALKTRFIADAAHDLGNPVGILQFEVELCKLEPDNRDEHLAIIEDQVERLDALVKDLLTLSRLDRGTLPTELQSIDINWLIEKVVSRQEPLARQRQISLQLQKEATLPAVEVDLHQIERTVTNLIANALNYTPIGGTIWINTGWDNNRVFFRVKDTGIGIPADELPHIFDRFFRGKTAQDRTEGTGLGLAITSEIISNHGGKIEVQSAPGQGSQFSVYLPIASRMAS